MHEWRQWLAPGVVVAVVLAMGSLQRADIREFRAEVQADTQGINDRIDRATTVLIGLTTAWIRSTFVWIGSTSFCCLEASKPMASTMKAHVFSHDWIRWPVAYANTSISFEPQSTSLIGSFLPCSCTVFPRSWSRMCLCIVL